MESLPIRSRYGIPFPIRGQGVSGRKPAKKGKTTYIIYYQKDEEDNIQRKVEISFEKAGDRLDICEAYNLSLN